MTIVLTTERLSLRQFTADDADYLVDLDSDPQVMRYLSGGTPTPREVIEQSILPRFIHSYAAGAGFGVWAAHEKASGDFIGWLSLRLTAGSDPVEAELGYRLRQSAWGRGYATEGARALIRKAFTELGVQRVTASTYEYNLASRRVMEKAGLTLARTYRYTAEEHAATPTFFLDTSQDNWEGDEVEYALTKAEWERQEAGS